MTTVTTPAATAGSPPALLEITRVLLVALVTGVALGVGDVWAKANLEPSQVALVNSSEGWAAAVLVLGFLLRTDPLYAAPGGAVMMLAAVEAYYVCHDSILQPDLSAWDSLSAQYWAVIGVPTGIVFATLGSWARLGVRRVRDLLT